MRVVSYNILNGGVGRADPIGEILAAQKDLASLADRRPVPAGPDASNGGN